MYRVQKEKASTSLIEALTRILDCRGRKMTKYLHEVVNFWEYKIFGAVFASVFTEDFFKLMVIFCFLEILDTVTRMIAESKHCYDAIYQGFPHTIWTYLKYMLTARKWRFIQTDKLRSGADKLLTYLLLILSATVVDSALKIAGADRVLLCTGIVVGFLSITEMLSIVENVSEFSNNNVVKLIKDKISKKLGGDK